MGTSEGMMAENGITEAERRDYETAMCWAKQRVPIDTWVKMGREMAEHWKAVAEHADWEAGQLRELTQRLRAELASAKAELAAWKALALGLIEGIASIYELDDCTEDEARDAVMRKARETTVSILEAKAELRALGINPTTGEPL